MAHITTSDSACAISVSNRQEFRTPQSPAKTRSTKLLIEYPRPQKQKKMGIEIKTTLGAQKKWETK